MFGKALNTPLGFPKETADICDNECPENYGEFVFICRETSSLDQFIPHVLFVVVLSCHWLL